MSSRTKRGASVSKTPTPTPAPAQETPQASTSGYGSTRSGSPLSPTRYNRLQEKADLQNLNDRLAIYIDRVRFLEAENSRLTREVHSSQEISTREVTSVKAGYEKEISDARKLVDSISHERARFELDNKKLIADLVELKKSYDEKRQDLVNAERNLSILEPRVNDLTVKVANLQTDKKKLTDELKSVQKERDRIAKKEKEVSKELEDEILHRIDLENSAQTLREEMAFKDQMHKKELIETTTTRRQVDISEIDGKLNAEYEEKLYQSLQEIRDQYEADLEDNKDQIKQLYEDKLSTLLQQSNRNASTATFAMKEMQQLHQKIEALHTKLGDLENLNGIQQMRIRELEQLYEGEKTKYVTEYTKLEGEITRLRNSMAEQLKDYQDLMDIKVALDIEIAAYRKLLEGEEERLNITPVVASGGRAGRGTPRRIIHPKRKRTILEDTEEETSSSNFSVNTTCSGDIEILEGCPDGGFIKLHNKSNKEVAIGGWQLLRKAGESRTSFKFHRSTKVEPDGFVTVWSSDSNVTHQPPANIVMKTQKWVVGDNMTTNLFDGSAEEIATMNHIRQQISRSAKTSRYAFPRFSANEELYHQQGDGERCSIM